MRRDDVEIKATFAGVRAESASRVLGLPEGVPPWLVYFCEDVDPAASPTTPLLDAGVVLRARARPQGSDDTTVKLRPCRRSQLTERWLAETDDLKLEADWAGDRRVLAASYSKDRRGPSVSEIVEEQRPVRDLFTDKQREFLADCAEIRVNLAVLTVLPPVTAIRWKTVESAPPALDLRAERWIVGDLDFLELSVAVPADEALARQQRLHGFCSSLGLDVERRQETKTRLVMNYLVAHSRRGVVPPRQ
jgi:hypothetical protein